MCHISVDVLLIAFIISVRFGRLHFVAYIINVYISYADFILYKFLWEQLYCDMRVQIHLISV